VSPGQYHNMSDDQRSFSKWNPQPESAMMPPTPTNQWGQTRPSFASKNPMDVILEVRCSDDMPLTICCDGLVTRTYSIHCYCP
jgi:hypothetical protein